ncbi:hypothetical protein FF38_10081 [Lucilia cuprina]|uniref:Nucleocapsid protein n=1 Tax=Lucilia cuprina TaxID=7375 RepID=A0A0L0C2G7_LUCCU|nr:hypothetical protein FF38_10081 [Lucilia cuprina]
MAALKSQDFLDYLKDDTCNFPPPKFYDSYIITFFKKKSPNDDQRTRDIFTILRLMLTKGPKALLYGGRNVSAEELFTINSLMAKYEIKKDATTTTTVTLSRIVAAYASYAFNLLVQEPNLHRPVPNSTMEKLGYINFPTYLSGPFIFGMIAPDTNIKREIYAMILAALHYMIEESFVFKRNKNPTDWEKNSEYGQRLSYAKSRMENNYIMWKFHYQKLLNDKVPEKNIAEMWIKSFEKAFPNTNILSELRLKICPQ